MTAVAEARPSTPLLAVQHAVRLLRTGGIVRVTDGAVAAAAIAAECIVDRGQAALALLPPGSVVVVTGQRLASLAAPFDPETRYELPLPRGEGAAALLAALVDPTAPPDAIASTLDAAVPSVDAIAAGAIELCKLAGLLPAVALTPEDDAGAPAAVHSSVPLAAIQAYRRHVAGTLKPVSEARVPLADAEQVRVIAFRAADGGPEQLAILVGEPEREPAPLARLHSECFTGDLLGSLRCDCGDQLRGAIRRMAHEGAGVLLYLAQEGRGIGLTNKLRAYMLQDGGLDTVDANHHLGFANDERDFWAAAAMLRQLGIGRVRLLTNNPTKLAQLERYGIEVACRVPHIFAANSHNHDYLMTKACRSGHLFGLEDIEPGKNGTDGPRLSMV